MNSHNRLICDHEMFSYFNDCSFDGNNAFSSIITAVNGRL